MSRHTFIGLLAALACALIGSGWQIMSRHAVTTTLGPLELAVLRYGVPALVLAPLLWRTGLFPQGVSAQRLACMVVGGGLPFGLLALAGVQWAPAAHMGIFLAGSVPLFTALGARVVLGERLAPWRTVGLLLVLVGLAVLGAHGLSSALAAWRGDLLFVAAAMVWAMYTLAFRGSGLTPWQGAAVVGQGVDNDGGILTRFHDLIQITDCADTGSGCQGPVLPFRAVLVEQETPDQIGGRHVFVTRYRDQRAL